MTLTPLQLAVALDQALEALERAGVPRELVVLAFTNPHDPAGDGTDYESHLGATRDSDNATLLQIVAQQLAEESRRAAVALCRDESCPWCGSPRLAYLQKREPGNRLAVYDDCLDCDYRAHKR